MMKGIERIIRDIQRGEADAFVEIINQYQSVVFNLAYRMTGDSQDAFDLSQDVFIKVYRSIGRFDEKRPFFPWLFAIAINLIRDYLRKRYVEKVSRIQFTPDNADVSRLNSPEQELVQKQENEAVQYQLLGLPVILREAVVMRYFGDLTFSEIAEISNISLSAAKMRVYRGLRLMEENLNG